MIYLSKKLFYVLGVDTQDFVLADTDEDTIWNKIEALQLEKYLIEKKCPKKKYKKIDGVKTQTNVDEIETWQESS